MIIGNGLLANEFFSQGNSFEDCIILCAGVSNSLEKDLKEYEREKKLIDTFLQSEKRLVYFSTVSVFDRSRQDTIYVQHKKEIETYITNTFKKYAIIRLPIVVSQRNNPNQLMGYLRTRIENREQITIHTKASRYFFDVKDIPKTISYLVEYLEKYDSNTVINVCFQKSISMMAIAELIAIHFPYIDLEFKTKGDSYFVNFTEFQSLVGPDASLFSSFQPVKMLENYLKKIKNEEYQGVEA